MTGDMTRAPRYLIPAEVGLVLLTLATIYGFSRIFSSTEFVPQMVVVAGYTHVVTLAARRRGLGVPTAAIIAALGLVLVLSCLFFFSTTIAGLPTSSTLDAAKAALNTSWDAFHSVVAPAPPLPGFVLASCGALFFAVFLADWAAFRLWSAFEAVVPAATLFIFCSLLNSPVHRIDSAAIFIAGLFTFLLLHRIAQQETSPAWLTADIARGSIAGVKSGAVVAVLALVMGVLVGPHLPGTNSPPVIPLRTGTGPSARTTISPLVNMRDRLVKQAQVELFTVKTTERSYWRLTSLDTFGGDIWSSGGTYTSVDGEVDAPTGKGAKAVTATQTFSISQLKMLWLPAAFQPKRVATSSPVRWQNDSSTLIVETDMPDSDGMAYTVESALPRFTADELRGAAAAVPDIIKARYTKLPDDFSAEAKRLALEVTKGATTPYDKARRLQDFFQNRPQDNRFQYTANIASGHGENAIEAFLRDRKGFCEQFAGTYAAMARSIGLPSRVAVGFTPGDVDPNDPTIYRVRGEHAHAWPEIYLGQYGWVPFEPTVSRGAPGAQGWTGLNEEQANEPSPLESPLTEQPGDTGTEDPLTADTLPPQEAGTIPDVVPTLPEQAAPAEETSGWGTVQPVVQPIGIGLGFVVVLVVAYIVIGLLVLSAAHRRRRSRATDPSATVRVAWAEAVEALEMMGLPRLGSETHAEYADRVGPELGEAGPVLVRLARDVDAAAYAPEILAADIAARAEEGSRAIVEAVKGRMSGVQYDVARLRPQSLLPRRSPTARRWRTASTHT